MASILAVLLLAPALGHAQAPLRGRPLGTDDDPPPGAPPSRPRVVMRLDYIRAPGAEACPDEQGFRDAVGAQVRKWDPFAPNGPSRLVVIVSRKGDGYEGSLELRDVTGALELTRAYPPTPRCLDLLGDLARAIALKIDPPSPAPPAVPTLPSDAPPKPSEGPLAPPPPAPAPKALSVRLGVGTWMDLASAPRPAFGLSVDLGLRVAWFSIAVEGRWNPPAGAMVADGIEVSTSRLLGALVPCGHIGWFAGCLLGELGQIRGSTHVPDATPDRQATPDHQASLYLAGGARLSAEIPVVRDILFVRLAADLTGARPAVFRIKDPTATFIAGRVTRWETASFTAGLGAGLIASF